MPMIETLSLVVVVLSALYLVGLAAASLLAPVRASRFLLGFAGSARAHYIELLLRMLAGTALVLHAPRMLFASAFSVFGWILLVTTAVLLLIPWQWHRRFAQAAVPTATRYIALVGLGSLAIGGLMLAAVVGGTAA